MSDNIIKFRKPKPVKTKVPMRPGIRRLLVICGVVVAFALVYIYFALSTPQ